MIISWTRGPPPGPMPSAVTAACCAMLLAPLVLWLWMTATACREDVWVCRQGTGTRWCVCEGTWPDSSGNLEQACWRMRGTRSKWIHSGVGARTACAAQTDLGKVPRRREVAQPPASHGICFAEAVDCRVGG